jgi:peroxiredoxin
MKWFIAFFVAVFLIIPAYALKPGEKIKGFELRDYNGEMHYSKNLCGEGVKNQGVLIIDFFATWCQPCRRTLEVLKKLYVKYKDKGMRVVLISFQEKERTIREFAEANKVPFPVLMDKYGDMAKGFGVYGLPRTFVIKGDCTIKKQIIGEQINLEEMLEREIEEEVGAKRK